MRHKSLVRILGALCIVEHKPALEILHNVGALHSVGDMYPTYLNLAHVRILWVVHEDCDACMLVGINTVNSSCLMPLVPL